MAELGFTSMDEMVGRSDVLEMDDDALHYKSRNVDLSDILLNSATLNENSPIKFVPEEAQDHKLYETLDSRPGGLVEQAYDALEGHVDGVDIVEECNNAQRSVGATLSYEVSRREGVGQGDGGMGEWRGDDDNNDR